MCAMADLPPSYEEVVKNAPIRPLRREPSTGLTPSAPTLEAIDGELPSQSAPPYPYAQDERFSAWDDRATKILVINRLDMNDRFEDARDQTERYMLWNVIRNHLLTVGYSFAHIDLVQYWKYIFSIYKGIINDLHSGTWISTHWKYFEPIDKVFKYTTKRPKSRNVEDLDDTVMGASPSHRMFSIVHEGFGSDPFARSRANNGVVTTQPRSSARGYVPIETTNRDDNNDTYCCCCWPCAVLGCCQDNPSAYIARSNVNTRRTATGTNRTPAGASRTTTGTSRTARETGRTSGYTGRSGYSSGYSSRSGGYTGRTHNYTGITDEYNSRNDHYNTLGIADRYNDYSTGLTGDDNRSRHSNDDNYRHTSSHSNDDNHRHNSNGGNDDDHRHTSSVNNDDNYRHTSSHSNDDNHRHNSNGGNDDDHRHTSSVNNDDNHRHTSSYSNDDNHCHTSSHSNDDNHHRSTSNDDNHHCPSSNHTNNDTDGGSTSYSCNDTGGGSYSYSDTGGGNDYGCSDTADYSCDTGGGND